MRSGILLLAAALAVLGTSGAGAQEEELGNEGSVALGYVGTSGNTETRTFNIEVIYALLSDNWVHNLKFQGLGSQENSVTRAERYYLEDKSNYNFSDTDYLFGSANYTDDRFSGFDYQAAVSAGYGRYFFNRDDFVLEGFGGPGYRQSSISDGQDQGEVIVTLGENLRWEISDSSSLTQSLTTEVGQELTVTRFEIGLISNIIGQIATKIAFQARNISEVPAERENTDTQTSISLVYEF